MGNIEAWAVAAQVNGPSTQQEGSTGVSSLGVDVDKVTLQGTLGRPVHDRGDHSPNGKAHQTCNVTPSYRIHGICPVRNCVLRTN